MAAHLAPINYSPVPNNRGGGGVLIKGGSDRSINVNKRGGGGVPNKRGRVCKHIKESEPLNFK